MPITAVRQEVKTRFSHHWSAARSAASPQAGRNPDRLGRKGERQRHRIIEQALDLFSAKGYHRTHVSDITEGLGISKGTFYLYFRNKHDLFVAVFDHLSRVLTRTEEKIADETDIYTRMSERIRAYFLISKIS